MARLAHDTCQVFRVNSIIRVAAFPLDPHRSPGCLGVNINGVFLQMQPFVCADQRLVGSPLMYHCVVQGDKLLTCAS